MIRRVATQILLLSMFAVPALAQRSAHQTQGGLNEAGGNQLMAAEADMKHVLDQLNQTAKDKREALVKLRKAQDAWERYRDAQLNAVWPFPEHGGNVYPMCIAAFKAALTEARTRELRQMLSPREGDACTSQWPGE